MNDWNWAPNDQDRNDQDSTATDRTDEKRNPAETRWSQPTSREHWGQQAAHNSWSRPAADHRSEPASDPWAERAAEPAAKERSRPAAGEAPQGKSTGGGGSRLLKGGVALLMLLLVATTAGAVAGGATALWLADTFVQDADRAAAVPASVQLDAEQTGAEAEPISSTLLVPVDEPYVDVVRATRPAVVTVMNMRRARQPGSRTIETVPAGSGSGVIFDARGYIATNYHVVQGNQGLEVLFIDGRRVPVELVGSDQGYDVAILKLPTGTELPGIAPLADSSAVEPGMAVLAIGSPLGADYQNTVTTGIVAGLNRQITEQKVEGDFWRGFRRVEVPLNYAPLIQTDAAINKGNSGGPLINLDGEVIGLNTLVVRGGYQGGVEGLGLAVPSNVVRALGDEWVDGVPRPRLGIAFATVDHSLAMEQNLPEAVGAIITEVEPDSAADRGGLQAGDWVMALDGTRLDLDRALTELLWRYRGGDTITLTIRRGGETLETDVTLDAAPVSRSETP